MSCEGVNGMAWDHNKRTQDRDRVEIELREAFEYIHELEERLKRLSWLVDEMTAKMHITNVCFSQSPDDNKR